MTSGRKAVPTVLKGLHGNPGKRAINTDEPQGQGTLWDPPPWFDDKLATEWAYAVQWAPPGLLTATDRNMLAVWVAASVEHARACQQVRQHGQVVKTRDGNAIQNPYLGVMNRQALIMIRAASELGFSPAARASLGSRVPEGIPHETTPGRSRLEAYLARKPDRLDS